MEQTSAIYLSNKRYVVNLDLGSTISENGFMFYEHTLSANEVNELSEKKYLESHISIKALYFFPLAFYLP